MNTKVRRPQHVQRPGVGFPVDVTLGKVEVGGLANAELHLGSAPVPDRRFACDAASVNLRDGRCRLLLAQSKPVGNGWLSMLVFDLTAEAVTMFLRAVDKNASPVYRSDANLVNDLTEFSESAEQNVVLTANLIIAGYAGTEGCMDFYHASPFALQQIALTKSLMVDPVVRVSLPVRLVFGIVHRLRALSPDLLKSNSDTNRFIQ